MNHTASGAPPIGPLGGPIPRQAARPDPDDPIALRSERLFGLFANYLAYRMSRDFHAVRIARHQRPGPPPGAPVIIYTNHASWWDPALYIVLNHRLLAGRPGFGPMDQAAFERYRVFRRMGVFGIPLDGHAGARRFLDVSGRVLDLPGGTLWINAEGVFADPRARPLALRPGLAHLVRRRPDALVIPLALELGFWNESRPEALVRFGAPLAPAGSTAISAITERLTDALTATMDDLAADVIARDPGRFDILVRGRTGADRIYDTWRRTRSLLRGRRFDPAHEAQP